MFNTCVAPFSVSPIISRCVFHVLRNFLVGVVVGRFAWCLSANSPMQLYTCPWAHVSTFLPFFPNLVSKYVLFRFQKHLQNKLHIGVIELKCQLWPFEVQYLQREGGWELRFLRESFFVPPAPLQCLTVLFGPLTRPSESSTCVRKKIAVLKCLVGLHVLLVSFVLVLCVSFSYVV